uniref:Putative GHMP kinase family protein n=1 Tax=viral metagenome TaxID=1070528 RepID=A0A6M3JCZ9_9ZZZZ
MCIIHSVAPLRIGIGGGSSDLAQFIHKFGGEVLNVTINKCVYSTLVPRQDEKIKIHSEDYDIKDEYDIHKDLPYNGELSLVCGTINRIKKDFDIPKIGFDIYLRSDAPPGAGLGTSSAVVVSILGLFRQWCNLDVDRYELAHLAWSIEREDMKMAGGKQDEYSSTFGGFNLMKFHQDDTVTIIPLRIPRNTELELRNNLLLIYSGKTHKSGDIIMSQTPNTEEKFKWINHIKDISHSMVEDILAKDLSNFGELLSLEWEYKKRLSNKVSNEHLENLHKIAMDNGANGAKITGAGGGGMFVIYASWDKRCRIIKAMESKGCKNIDFNFNGEGLKTWSIRDEKDNKSS